MLEKMNRIDKAVKDLYSEVVREIDKCKDFSEKVTAHTYDRFKQNFDERAKRIFILVRGVNNVISCGVWTKKITSTIRPH